MFNVTGHPALSVPIGLAADGMPLAVQVVGRSFDEATVLQVCRAIEVLTGWEKISLPSARDILRDNPDRFLFQILIFGSLSAGSPQSVGRKV